jgi:hypothetical protein
MPGSASHLRVVSWQAHTSGRDETAHIGSRARTSHERRSFCVAGSYSIPATLSALAITDARRCGSRGCVKGLRDEQKVDSDHVGQMRVNETHDGCTREPSPAGSLFSEYSERPLADNESLNTPPRQLSSAQRALAIAQASHRGVPQRKHTLLTFNKAHQSLTQLKRTRAPSPDSEAFKRRRFANELLALAQLDPSPQYDIPTRNHPQFTKTMYVHYLSCPLVKN